ncbi:ABC transporter permease [Caldisericum exile]|uniref:ABC transporter permease protein n=1 Tax=Caldisericum exile (strain DSM 21853 / NBRC 104410 / AZM16c01) TaxID=511051 RepID=A0A7U6GFT4_CALEA|nr:ABC transporter permease subunit [Caldisericum exile]BAL81569.1 ABC transporter permease protein [Caldisericum exile AZM16c01]
MVQQEHTKEGGEKPRPSFPLISSFLFLLPFIIFVVAFLILPTISIFISAFQDSAGKFTLQNIKDLFTPYIMGAYLLSIRVSLFTAIIGAFIGFMLAYASTFGNLPSWVKSYLNTFSGVASNFAGVPLAFAFISTLGRVGLITTLIQQIFHISIYDFGFNLYSFWGLCLTYIYFQIPLMVLLMTPALEGMKKEWREGAENLGATNIQYWFHIGLPILLPTILANTVLLFGNAFGAYATAYALTGGFLNLVPIIIGAEIRGDILHNVGLGYALALGMIVIMGVTILSYNYLQSKTARWLK